jgi:hypothetical protein
MSSEMLSLEALFARSTKGDEVTIFCNYWRLYICDQVDEEVKAAEEEARRKTKYQYSQERKRNFTFGKVSFTPKVSR